MTPAGVVSISTARGAGPAVGRLGDRRLARLAAKGDPRAFAAIYERHHQDVFRYCRSITGNAEDASDALQSTMAAALRALPGERREIALRPWLFRIAHNESVAIIRRRASYVELTDTEAPAAQGPYAVASMRERLTGLVADLQELPERQRGAIVMRELIGLDYGEIAAALNVSGGAARQAVFEARLALSQSDEGREMACDAARRSISARDGRVLRGRRMRAHMRGCTRCTQFSEQLGARRSVLPSLLPPLPAAAGVAILGGLVGGAASVGTGASIGALGSAGSGGFMSILAGGASQAAGASAAAKGAAAAVAVAVVAGVGTVEVAKQVDAPPPPGRASVKDSTGHSRPATTRAALTPVRRRSAPSSSERVSAQRPAGAGSGPSESGGAGSGAPDPDRRAPHEPRRPAEPGILPVSDPSPTPAAPAPAPVPAPAPPAAPPRYPSIQPSMHQQQYTDGMRQAQLGLQIGQQAFRQAMQLTQQILNGVFPRAPRR